MLPLHFLIDPPQSTPQKYFPPQNYDQHYHQRPPPQQYGPYHYKHSGFRPTCATTGDSYCLFDRDYPM